MTTDPADIQVNFDVLSDTPLSHRHERVMQGILDRLRVGVLTPTEARAMVVDTDGNLALDGVRHAYPDYSPPQYGVDLDALLARTPDDFHWGVRGPAAETVTERVRDHLRQRLVAGGGRPLTIDLADLRAEIVKGLPGAWKPRMIAQMASACLLDALSGLMTEARADLVLYPATASHDAPELGGDRRPGGSNGRT